jgi:hypothetical protein
MNPREAFIHLSRYAFEAEGCTTKDLDYINDAQISLLDLIAVAEDIVVARGKLNSLTEPSIEDYRRAMNRLEEIMR